MDQLIGATLTEKDALTFIQTLYEEEVITKKGRQFNASRFK